MIQKTVHLKFISSDHADFLKTLRSRVDTYFHSHTLSTKYDYRMIVKSIIMLTLFVTPFIAYCLLDLGLYPSIGLWSIMAIGVSGIGMCIMHDANHGAYTDSHTMNEWIGKIINWLGGSAFNWKIQHNILHHTYTNIVHYDDDIDDKAILKLSPHAKSQWYHRYQYIYAFLFYSIATLYWCTVKDFIQLYRYTHEGLNKNSKSENIWQWINLLLSKIAYFGVFLIIPSLLFGISMQKTIICFLIMHLWSGLILTTVFQLAHTVDTTIHPLPTENTITQNWAVHQMQTTSNFARDNRFVSWWVGGLNFQIEHHLFPNICHIHYPNIAPLVKQTATEFGLPYLEFDSVSSALHAHIRALKKFSK